MNIEVYNLLKEQTYPNDSISCRYMSLYVELKVVFSTIDDLEKFKKLVFTQLNLNIKTGIDFFEQVKQKNLFNINDMKKSHYEEMVKQISFYIPTNALIKFPEYTIGLSIINFGDNNLPLYNLPSNLKKLRINSFAPCDLSNLPSNLIELELEYCKCNLDNLPPSLKILKIDSIVYPINNFINLPPNLTHMEICDKIYNSVDDFG